MFSPIGVDDAEHFVAEGAADAPVGTELELIVDGSLNTAGIFGSLSLGSLGHVLGSGASGNTWHLGLVLGRSLKGDFNDTDSLKHLELSRTAIILAADPLQFFFFNPNKNKNVFFWFYIFVFGFKVQTWYKMWSKFTPLNMVADKQLDCAS